MPVPAGPSSVVTVDEVKLRLNKTLTVDDDEIQSMIDAAEAYYARVIGPLSGTVTETVDGGSTAIVLGSQNVSAITEAAYSDGTAIDTADLDLNTSTGIVYWGYGTAGRFSYGTRNVVLTYTIGTLPADHREVIIADVAGYFAATQRGGGSQDRRFPGEGYAAVYEPPGTPLTLFPRIGALAPPVIA